MAEKLVIAASPEEAVKAKNDYNIFLAGGTEIMRLGSPYTADSFVSVRKIPSMHEVTADGNKLCIGASCTFQELLDNATVPGYLKTALRYMASRTRRNMATIGGNIAVKRDDSFLIPTLLAADAKLRLLDCNSDFSEISLTDFILNDTYPDNALIISVVIPNDDINIVSHRSSNTAQSHARLTLSLSQSDDCYRAFAAIKNHGIVRLDCLEEAFNSGSDISEDEILELVRSQSGINLEDDLLYGSADYIIYLLGIHFALMFEDLKSKGGRA